MPHALIENLLALLDLSDGQNTERRLDAVGRDLRVDRRGELSDRLVVEVRDQVLNRAGKRRRLRRGLLLLRRLLLVALPFHLGDGLGVHVAARGATRLVRADLARSEVHLLVALTLRRLLFVDLVVVVLRLVERAVVPALARSRVGVLVEIVGSPVVRVDAERVVTRAHRFVQLDGVVLVAVGLDVGDLQHRLLQDLEVRRELGLARLSLFPRFYLRHSLTYTRYWVEYATTLRRAVGVAPSGTDSGVISPP